MEFLVLPRMLALMLMMPLLALYATCSASLGGLLVGVGAARHRASMQYLIQTQRCRRPHCISRIGLIKASVFGVLVALAGCLRGMQCGRSAAAVGEATTSAVVTGIVCIIVA